MRDPESPLLLRFAVVIGGVTLLLGLAGAVLLLVEGDDDAPIHGPGLGSRLRVLGAPEGADLAVDLSWTLDDMEESSAALRLGTEGDAFLLPPTAANRFVVLEIRDQQTGDQVLFRREMRVRRGEELVVDLDAPDESGP